MHAKTYRVAGLTCEHCVRAVTDELEAVDGVSAVAVTLVAGGESLVTVTSARPVAVAQLQGALDEAGSYRLVGQA